MPNWPRRDDSGGPPRSCSRHFDPAVVVDIEVDAAYEHHWWRHCILYARPRPDMSVYDVPLILDEGEDPFSGYARTA
ncbi:hypothetical protein [Micromonospora globispora]|uniref:hypothetical protein n=1 Tax=Micromonospora globispora TaxID=1450148 RepID=UPI000F4ED4BF|nr:hypothetical protein [Micromonospora globispora]